MFFEKSQSSNFQQQTFTFLLPKFELLHLEVKERLVRRSSNCKVTKLLFQIINSSPQIANERELWFGYAKAIICCARQPFYEGNTGICNIKCMFNLQYITKCFTVLVKLTCKSNVNSRLPLVIILGLCIFI